MCRAGALKGGGGVEGYSERRPNQHLVFLFDPFLLSSPLHVLKDSVFMNYLSMFQNVKLVMSLSRVLSPRAS